MAEDPKSPLRQSAEALSAAAHQILAGLEHHDGKPHQIEYGRLLARKMRPVLAAFDHAVFEARSREQAADVLSDLNRHVSQAGVSASKGEMDFDFGTAHTTYARLQTIFREPEHRDQRL